MLRRAAAWTNLTVLETDGTTDSGQYWCSASNAVGGTEIPVTLLVKSKIPVTLLVKSKIPVTLLVKSNMPVTLLVKNKINKALVCTPTKQNKLVF